MNVFDFNIDVVNRFLSDCDIPIKTVSKDVFFKRMSDYPEYWKKWEEFVEMVNRDFSGDPREFLDYYYKKREEMITALKNPFYEKFNEGTMNAYPMPQKLIGHPKSVWQSKNSGGTYISFDLKTANFQALKFVDVNIVLGCGNWGELCGKFTGCRYIADSKYIRQVVFGQLNPGRHTTVEKYMIGLVHGFLEKHGITGGLIDKGLMSLCAVSVDELVFRVDESVADSFVKSSLLRSIEKGISDECCFEVKATPFKADEYRLVANVSEETSGKEVCSFFVKTNLESGKKKLVCVPQTYHAIAMKLAQGLDVLDYDRHFVYEGIDCILNENFKIIDAQGNTMERIL